MGRKRPPCDRGRASTACRLADKRRRSAPPNLRRVRRWTRPTTQEIMVHAIDPHAVTRKLPPTQPDFAAIKAKQQATWASGDFAVIGTTLQIVGESLLLAGQRRLHTVPRIQTIASY